jgi:DNA modification methylase
MNLDEIENIDWDFKNADTRYLTHDLHAYRAKFIPQIPAFLIPLFTQKNEVVLDPFCGCGTALLEAMRLERRSIGMDINPLAVLISKVKTTIIEKELLNNSVTSLLSDLEKLIGDHRLFHSQIDSTIPNFPNKGKWFDPAVLKELGIIKRRIEIEDDSRLKNFYTVCFSSILKNSCSQKEDFSYIADNMLPERTYYVDVLKIFKKKVQKTACELMELEETCSSSYRPEVVNSDASQPLLKSDSVDFVVTSPPYPNTTDYVKMFRLSFYWSNWDIDKWKEGEIGARWRRGQKEAIDWYFHKMKACFSEIARVMRVGAHCCIVIGDSVRDKKRILAVKGLQRIMEANDGMKFCKKIDRKISKSGLSFRSVTRENIMVFEKIGRSSISRSG